MSVEAETANSQVSTGVRLSYKESNCVLENSRTKNSSAVFVAIKAESETELGLSKIFKLVLLLQYKLRQSVRTRIKRKWRPETKSHVVARSKVEKFKN